MSNLPNTATRAERIAAHRHKMIEKAMRYFEGHYGGQLKRGARISANLSRHHPDYGRTLADHLARKAKREAR